MPDHHHLAPPQGRKAAQDRLIVAKRAVTRQHDEIVEQTGDVILEMGPFGVARDLRLLPRGQLGEGIAQQLVRFGLQAADVRIDVDGSVGCGVAQLVDPPLKFGDRLFEIEETWHRRRLGARAAQVNAGPLPPPGAPSVRPRPRRFASASGWRVLTRSTSRAASTCV